MLQARVPPVPTDQAEPRQATFLGAKPEPAPNGALEVQRMSGKKNLVLAVLVLATVAVAPAAQAQMRPSWELTPFGGWFLAGDLYSYSGGTLRVDDAVTFGGRIGANLNEQFGIEASYAHANSDLSYTGLLPDGAPGLGSVGFDEIDLNGNFGSGFYRQAYGYFTFGMGMTVFTPHTFQVDSGTITRFATNIGIGGKYFFHPKLGLRIDARYRLTSTDITTDGGTYCDPYWGCYSYYSTWYDTGEITAGLTYKLGGQ